MYLTREPKFYETTIPSITKLKDFKQKLYVHNFFTFGQPKQTYHHREIIFNATYITFLLTPFSVLTINRMVESPIYRKHTLLKK